VSERATLELVQVVVKVDDGDFCAVLVPPGCADHLIDLIRTFSDGPIKLARLPGVEMIPIRDLEP